MQSVLYKRCRGTAWRSGERRRRPSACRRGLRRLPAFTGRGRGAAAVAAAGGLAKVALHHPGLVALAEVLLLLAGVAIIGRDVGAGRRLSLLQQQATQGQVGGIRPGRAWCSMLVVLMVSASSRCLSPSAKRPVLAHRRSRRRSGRGLRSDRRSRARFRAGHSGGRGRALWHSSSERRRGLFHWSCSRHSRCRRRWGRGSGGAWGAAAVGQVENGDGCGWLAPHNDGLEARALGSWSRHSCNWHRCGRRRSGLSSRSGGSRGGGCCCCCGGHRPGCRWSCLWCWRGRRLHDGQARCWHSCLCCRCCGLRRWGHNNGEQLRRRRCCRHSKAGGLSDRGWSGGFSCRHRSCCGRRFSSRHSGGSSCRLHRCSSHRRLCRWHQHSRGLGCLCNGRRQLNLDARGCSCGGGGACCHRSGGGCCHTDDGWGSRSRRRCAPATCARGEVVRSAEALESVR